MNLRTVIYDIKETFAVYSDDNNISDEHIAYLFQTKRAVYLKNYLSNLQKTIPQQAKMQICLSLVEDDLCEDDFLILRSTERLPTTIESTGRANITEVYLNSRLAKHLNIIDYQRIPYLKGARNASSQTYISIDPDDYIIVCSLGVHHEFIEDLKLNIVPENPEEAYDLLCREDNTCDFFDWNYYPIPAEMIDPIKKEILNDLLLKYKIPVDVINNAEDETVNKNNLQGRTNRNTKSN